MGEEGLEARGIKRLIAEASLDIELSEFADGLGKMGLQGQRGGELHGSLRGGARKAAPGEDALQFVVQAGGELRIGAQRRGCLHLEIQAEPAEEGTQPIEAQNDKKEN